MSRRHGAYKHTLSQIRPISISPPAFHAHQQLDNERSSRAEAPNFVAKKKVVQRKIACPSPGLLPPRLDSRVITRCHKNDLAYLIVCKDTASLCRHKWRSEGRGAFSANKGRPVSSSMEAVMGKVGLIKLHSRAFLGGQIWIWNANEATFDGLCRICELLRAHGKTTELYTTR